MPVFEGLFPNLAHSRAVQDILFTMAEWHANAKLHIHTTSMLRILEELMCSFGIRICHFANQISPQYDTRELPKEEAACICRHAKKQSSGGNANTTTGTTVFQRIKCKLLSLTIYKFHAMGDYVSQIKMFGMTDSYSTQTVGLFVHR